MIQEDFPVLGMNCAACANRLEKALNKEKGVKQASVNFASASVLIRYNPKETNPKILKQRTQNLGYDLELHTENRSEEELERKEKEKFKKQKIRTIAALLFAVPIVILGMFFMDNPYANFFMWILSTPVVFIMGAPFFKNAWTQLLHHSVNMDTLVALSTGIAYFFSLFNLFFPEFWIRRGVTPHVYFEAASVIIAFILLGRLLEEKAKGNTSLSLKKLMGLQPQMVTLVEKDGSTRKISVKKVQVGDILLVKPGEKIAVDGKIVEGNSYVDESLLTGEPVSVFKENDSTVFAGTINQKGSFNFRAEKVGAEMLLSQIIKSVREAQGSKAPVQKLADRIAGIFVPIVMTIALISFILWVILDPVNGFTHGLLAMVTVLIIACPCALGLATPTAVVVGIGKAAESGILIKDAESLEIAKEIDTVVFDKTGTLTEGKPVVSDFLGNESWKNLFYHLEKKSEHPLAEAICDYLAPHGDFLKIEAFENIPGKGVKCFYKGEYYYAGRLKLLEENHIFIDSVWKAETERLEKEAKTVVWFSDSNQVLAVAGVTDKIKESSREAVKKLKMLGLDLYMISGDHAAAVKNVAEKTGISHYEAGMLPQEKADFIKKLRSSGKKVAMVGDGINDSAALAFADLSIAMGKGSAIAMQASQVTIISSNLLKIPEAILLSGMTVRTIKQNLFWAFIYNLIALPAAAGILYPVSGFLINPMVAGIAMAFSSVSVVSNSLRLKTKRPFSKFKGARLK